MANSEATPSNDVDYTSSESEIDDSYFEFDDDSPCLEQPCVNLVDRIVQNKDDKWYGKKMVILDKLLDLSTPSELRNLDGSKKSAFTVTNRNSKNEIPSTKCLLRIKNDILEIYNETPPGIFIVPDEKDLTRIHALIIGPSDTPYQGGFFYFIIDFPQDYPINPPKVEFMTTGEGTVRFNPNLYSSGKVCLSIIGTWSGPKWSPVLTLSSVLVSIQSLMNEHPYCNEPGYENREQTEASKCYNEIIQYQTLRVAVCDMLEGNTRDVAKCPPEIKDVIEESFPEHYEHYAKVVRSKQNYTSQEFMEPFSGTRNRCDYSEISQRLENIKERLKSRRANI